MSSPTSGSGQVAFSSEGTHAFVPGASASAANSIDWLTREGRVSVLRGTKAEWAQPRFSPDGQKLALTINDGKRRNIWVYDMSRDTLTQLTLDAGDDSLPVWTPDGKRIVFGSDRAKPGIRNLYWVNADGTGEVTRPFPGPGGKWRVSTVGGIWPRWSRAAPELMFVSLYKVMFAPFAVKGIHSSRTSAGSGRPRAFGNSSVVLRTTSTRTANGSPRRWTGRSSRITSCSCPTSSITCGRSRR